MQLLKDITTDEERALYGLHGATLDDCVFDGPKDGESALKECSELTINRARFNLRYPLWHLQDGLLMDCTMTEGCRAPLWYGNRLTLRNCTLNGVKAIRECDGVVVDNCSIISDEFGWKSRHFTMQDSSVDSKYAFLDCNDLTLKNIDFTGRYSFQYVNGATLDFCTLNTKDAFWHAKNITITDSILEGEYLGWYSENLTLIHCVISGTQPFVSCKNLTLIDCRMEESCDLAFERSEVNATIRGSVTSIKNPLHGKIVVEKPGTIILDNQAAPGSDCAILLANGDDALAIPLQNKDN